MKSNQMRKKQNKLVYWPKSVVKILMPLVCAAAGHDTLQGIGDHLLNANWHGHTLSHTHTETVTRPTGWCTYSFTSRKPVCWTLELSSIYTYHSHSSGLSIHVASSNISSQPRKFCSTSTSDGLAICRGLRMHINNSILMYNRTMCIMLTYY